MKAKEFIERLQKFIDKTGDADIVLYFQDMGVFLDEMTGVRMNINEDGYKAVVVNITGDQNQWEDDAEEEESDGADDRGVPVNAPNAKNNDFINDGFKRCPVCGSTQLYGFCTEDKKSFGVKCWHCGHSVSAKIEIDENSDSASNSARISDTLRPLWNESGNNDKKVKFS